MNPRGNRRGSSVAYVIGTYPSLTTTFVDREIREVRRRGTQIRIVSLRRPRRMLSPEQHELGQNVEYILPTPLRQVLRAHIRWVVRRPGTYVSVLARLVTASHPSARARLKTLLHIAEGVVVADVLSRGSRVAHIHAHFVDRATTVAIVASRLLGIGYSATAHANDIYVNPVLLEEKISGATSVVTCTQYNQRYLGSILPDSSNVEVVYHGLDLSRFSGDRDEAPSPMVLSVAQLREKKGLVHLIDAIHAMRGRAIPVRCVIAGDGPLRSELEAQIHDLGLEDVIELKGAIPHDEVIDLMRRAWLFALPAVVASDGDRDGIPNVILEALATGLPVVSTRHSGIPEIVVDGISGALVPPADPIALSEAMERLIADPETRVELGRRGRSMVIESFDIVRNAERLIATWPTDPDHDRSGDFVPPPPFGKGS